MDDVTIRPWRPGDEVAINDAFNRVFRLDRPLDDWRWKFQRHEVPAPIMTAWRGGELLAHYAGVPALFQVDGRVVWAAQIVDVFSTPAARRRFARRGVYVRTVEAFFAEYGETGRFPLLYGFPGARALRLGLLQLGYGAMEPQPVTVWERPAGRARLAPRRFPYRAEPLEPDDPRPDRLWRRIGARYPVAAVRDGRRLAARLTGRPGVEYRTFLVTPRFSREPVAWVAFRTGDGTVRWADLVWDPAHPGALELAARLGEVLVRQTGAPGESLWLGGDPEAAAVLESLGFTARPEPAGLVMVARSFAGGPDVRAMEGRIYLTMADSDLV